METDGKTLLIFMPYREQILIILTIIFILRYIYSWAVKTPTIFLNHWLLKAHVESPLAGSIIFAAIVLKLSLYYLMRLILPDLPVYTTDLPVYTTDSPYNTIVILLTYSR
jgi:NADH:ubiquinone oxidoreductase subunit 4 (subunit M)